KLAQRCLCRWPLRELRCRSIDAHCKLQLQRLIFQRTNGDQPLEGSQLPHCTDYAAVKSRDCGALIFVTEKPTKSSSDCHSASALVTITSNRSLPNAISQRRSALAMPPR